MNKLLTLILGIFLIGLVSAQLGTFKQGECVNIPVVLNTSSVNISVLTDPTPNPSILLQNTPMTAQGGNFFNYTFCNTSKIGDYTYGFCDISGNCYSNDFQITSSGSSDSGANIAFFIIIIVLIYGITLIGFFGRNVTMTIIGGMAMLFLGVYLFNQGIIIFRDDVTSYISIFTMGLGAVLSIWAGIEVIQENLD